MRFLNQWFSLLRLSLVKLPLKLADDLNEARMLNNEVIMCSEISLTYGMVTGEKGVRSSVLLRVCLCVFFFNLASLITLKRVTVKF